MKDPTTKRRRHSREQRQRLLDVRSANSQTHTAFRQAKGSSLASFQNWKHRLATEVADSDLG